MRDSVKTFCFNHATFLEPSPPHAPQSNVVAERFMKELEMRAHVPLFAANIGNEMWAEAKHHGNWLRNRLLSERINGSIPILRWDNRTRIDFKNLPVFGQHGFAFLYQSKTRPNKELSARAIHGRFAGMESSETLYRLYIPESKKIKTRRQDFPPCTEDQLPGVSTLLDGIARQHELESVANVDGSSEDMLTQAFQAHHTALTHSVLGPKQNKRDPRLQNNFNEALKSKNWCDAIDREYNAIRDRNSWTYIRRTTDMHPVPFTWTFCLKAMDNTGATGLHKAKCFVRGDK